MLEMEYNVIEMNNAFGVLITKLDTAKDKINKIYIDIDFSDI